MPRGSVNCTLPRGISSALRTGLTDDIMLFTFNENSRESDTRLTDDIMSFTVNENLGESFEQL